MPKIRPIKLSLLDAERHLTVSRTRIRQLGNGPSNELVSEIDEIFLHLRVILRKLPQENDSYTDRELFLIQNQINKEIEKETKKELKKEVKKIDYSSAFKAMYSATSTRDAFIIAIKHGIDKEHVRPLILRAPPSTPLGKCISKLKEEEKHEKIERTQATITNDAITQPVGPLPVEDDNTIDSEIEPIENDPELKSVLGVE